MNSEKVEFHETISQQWEGIQSQNNSKITLRFLKEILCSAVPISKEELSGLITAVIKFFTGQILSLYENSHKTTAEKAIQFLEQLVHTNSLTISKQNLCEFYNATRHIFQKLSENQPGFNRIHKRCIIRREIKENFPSTLLLKFKLIWCAC